MAAVPRLGLFKISPAGMMHMLTGRATALRHGIGQTLAATRGGEQA